MLIFCVSTFISYAQLSNPTILESFDYATSGYLLNNTTVWESVNGGCSPVLDNGRLRPAEACHTGGAFYNITLAKRPTSFNFTEGDTTYLGVFAGINGNLGNSFYNLMITNGTNNENVGFGLVHEDGKAKIFISGTQLTDKKGTGLNMNEEYYIVLKIIWSKNFNNNTYGKAQILYYNPNDKNPQFIVDGIMQNVDLNFTSLTGFDNLLLRFENNQNARPVIERIDFDNIDGNVPEIEVSKTAIDFGQTLMNETKVDSFQVTAKPSNTSPITFQYHLDDTITGVCVNGITYVTPYSKNVFKGIPNNLEYQTLQPGESIWVKVQFQPGEANTIDCQNVVKDPNQGLGAQNAVFNIYTNPVSPSYFVDLNGEGVTQITGIEELTKSSISIFPNPATNVVNISTTSEIENITLYNNQHNVLEITKENALETSNLPSGLYFIEVSTTASKTFEKLIIE